MESRSIQGFCADLAHDPNNLSFEPSFLQPQKPQPAPLHNQHKRNECTLYPITNFINNNDKTYIDKKPRRR